MPRADKFSASVYFEEKLSDEENRDKHIIFSADGSILGDSQGFAWGDFVYELHYNLYADNVGLYFVGVITLFFFVALLSGVVIHWRKIIKNFFQYRVSANKDKLLDAHNLIGVMGLPFHIM